MRGRNMMYATPSSDWFVWDYQTGDPQKIPPMSISFQRLQYLLLLATSKTGDLTLAVKDKHTGAWTKWQTFWKTPNHHIVSAYDIHRSVMENEIVVESDYVCSDCTFLKKENLGSILGCLNCYKLNYDATKFIGAILEHKGFKPQYYYSGSKSIHVHMFLDFKCFLDLDVFLQNKIIKHFKNSRARFIKKFMEWLRGMIIDCWGLKNKEFDKAFVKTRHLIRSEMSRNKAGYKTYLGDQFEDVSAIPYICNEDNRVYPTIGRIELSRPHSIQELIEEFFGQLETTDKINRIRRKETSLMYWASPEKRTELRDCVRIILSEEFVKHKDGSKRGGFILSNELKRKFDERESAGILIDWNKRMGSPINNTEMAYRIKETKLYTLTCKYVHDFLKEIGFKEIKCKGGW